MRIHWFIRDEDGDDNFVFESEGYLPTKGDIIYMHDMRRGPTDTLKSRYKVLDAYQSVMLITDSCSKVHCEVILQEKLPDTF